MFDFRIYDKALSDSEVLIISDDSCPIKFRRSVDSCVPCSTGNLYSIIQEYINDIYTFILYYI